MQAILLRNPSLVMLVACLFWGLLWLPLQGLASVGVEGALLVAVSYGLMALLVAPWVWAQRRGLANHWRALLGIAVAGGMANLCFSLALTYGEVVRVMVLFYLLPVWGLLGGYFFLGETADVWRLGGAVLAVAGAVILLGGGETLWVKPSWVDLVAIVAGLGLAANNLFFRGVQALPLAPKLGAMFAGCAALAALALLVVPTDLTTISAQAWLWVIVYVLAWLLWANLGVQWAVTRMPVSRASILMVVELVAAVFSGVLLGGEQLTGSLIVGGALIVSATVIEIVRSRIPEAKRR